MLSAKAERGVGGGMRVGGGPKRSRTSQEPVRIRQLRGIVTAEAEQHRRAAESKRLSARVRAK